MTDKVHYYYWDRMTSCWDKAIDCTSDVIVDSVHSFVVAVVVADVDAGWVQSNPLRMVHRLACPVVSSNYNRALMWHVVVAYRNPIKTEDFSVIRRCTKCGIVGAGMNIKCTCCIECLRR